MSSMKATDFCGQTQLSGTISPQRMSARNFEPERTHLDVPEVTLACDRPSEVLCGSSIERLIYSASESSPAETSESVSGAAACKMAG